jgi:hypothetical protein
MTMPAVVLTDEGRIALQDRPRPTLRSDQVLIEVDMCGICGSDLHASQLPQVYRDRDRADNLADPASQDVPVVGQPLLQMRAGRLRILQSCASARTNVSGCFWRWPTSGGRSQR